MPNLELVKAHMCSYVDLDVFELGKLYYVLCKSNTNRKSAIATCIEKDEKHVTLKYIETITGNWKMFEDNLVIGTGVPSAKCLEIQPIELTYLIDPLNMKLGIKSEVNYKE